MSQDPLGPFADDSNHGNAYAYAGSRPTVADDPYGLITWDVDEKNCTITLRFKLRLEFKGFPSAFEEAATGFTMKHQIESGWNSNEALIRPKFEDYEHPAITNGPRGQRGGFVNAPCPCKDGFKARVAIDLVWGNGDGTEDGSANIIWDPLGRVRPYTNLKRRRTTITSGSVSNAVYYSAHEFGHLIGFGHPSGWGSSDRDYNEIDGSHSSNIMGSGGRWARKFMTDGLLRPGLRSSTGGILRRTTLVLSATRHLYHTSIHEIQESGMRLRRSSCDLCRWPRRVGLASDE